MWLNRLKAGPALGLVLSLLAGYHATAPTPPETGSEGAAKSTSRSRTRTGPVGDKRVSVDSYGDPLPAGAIARMGTLRLRHGDDVFAVAVSPDGKSVASASMDRTARLWDIKTGKELRRFQGHGDWISSVAFSPDGKTLATGGGSRTPFGRFTKKGDHTIRLWELATGKEVRKLTGHDGDVTSVVFSPNGKVLASAGDDRKIRQWDVATGDEVRQFDGQETFSQAIAFSPDGSTLAAGGEKHTIRLWDAATGKETARLTGHQEPILALAISPEGKTLAASCGDLARGKGDMALRFWDLATKKVVRTIKAADPLTDRFALLFGRHYGPVFSLAFVQGGKALAAGGLDFTIRFWEVSTGRLLRQIQGHEDWIGSLAAPPSGKILASAGTWRQTIRLWDTATGKELCPLMGHQGAVERVAFSADGKTLVTVSGREPVQLWDVLTGKYARHLDLGGPISFEFTHANGKLLAATRNESSLYVWDIDRGRPIRTFEARNAFARAVGLSPDGSTLAVADQYQGLRLLDVGTGKERLLFAGKYNGSEGLALSPDGKLLAVLGARVRLWQAATAKQIRQFPENESVIGRTITFSPDGKLLASGASEDDMVRLWDVATGKVVRQFPGFNLAFSPDGKTVAAADRVIRLWEVASGKERCRLPGHAAGVWTFAFSPDGRLLASGSKDTTALVWDVTALMRQGRLPTVRLSPEQLNSLWHDLAGDDACRAYQAVWKLTAAGEQSVTFLKGKLRPAAAADTRRIARLLGDLDSNRFTIRQKAADTLEQIGDLATPQLLDVLAKGPTAEVRRQVQLLLDKADGPVASLESLRQLRSVEVLEQIGTASARQVVDALGKGAPEARLTQEAKATLDRLARRSDAPR